MHSKLKTKQKGNLKVLLFDAITHERALQVSPEHGWVKGDKFCRQIPNKNTTPATLNSRELYLECGVNRATGQTKPLDTFDQYSVSDLNQYSVYIRPINPS